MYRIKTDIEALKCLTFCRYTYADSALRELDFLHEQIKTITGSTVEELLDNGEIKVEGDIHE